ncbi:MAG: Rrf2 family transcriptional regulator [Ignavibacteria bacterium]|nr:Rrf2 family transcriptional regulator [Ignavibacteria bacterium]
MLRINRQTDYAIRVLLALAKQPQNHRISTASIGKEMLIPSSLLTRIVAQMAQAKLILTFPGRDGGVQLAKPAEKINLREVVELMEGQFLLSECMLDQQECPFEGRCPVRKRWHRLQQVIVEELEKTNFQELAKETEELNSLGLIISDL